MSSIRAELRESRNYEWSTRRKIRDGAFGSIYRGEAKTSGTKVVVKCIKERFYSGIDETERIKLIGIIGMKHQNLVGLLAIEQEIDRRHFVLVMEVCKGLNMLEVLCKPENRNGLNETEFENVLKDLTSAVKFLRDHDIVHGNIKPQNILKEEVTDGNVIYKLTDFGTIRLFQIEEQFSTLKGAEVYMDPNCMRKFIFGEETIIIDENIDLWSIGVTLYQLATGSLPFKFTNKMMLYEFITKKDIGVIAATNMNMEGNIEFQSYLPDSCQLTRYLKRLLEQLLSGLLETHEDARWSYENYFEFVFTMLGFEASSMPSVFGKKIPNPRYSTKSKPTSFPVNDQRKEEGLSDDDEFADNWLMYEARNRANQDGEKLLASLVKDVGTFLASSDDFGVKIDRILPNAARNIYDTICRTFRESSRMNEINREKRSPNDNLLLDLGLIFAQRILGEWKCIETVSEIVSHNINHNHGDKVDD